ncbi:MAG: iron-containing alcohol dehydrogenase [Muribaculaceae bacterium]|nr:iron-containing alcohol dehydrogenase [Muribaculaceae bacterium]
MEWTYRQPVEIHFGRGKLDYLPEAIRKTGARRGLLVTSPSFVRRGIAARIMDLCGDTLSGIYSGVSPNPDVAECDACADMLRSGQCDIVVAVGGGSVIDCAKAAAAVCRGTAPAAGYLDGNPLPAGILPLIAVPTTAGTGSEVTSVAVLSDHRRGIKAPLSSDGFYPRIAIVDPSLTDTMSPYMTACTGFDVLCHAIEAYWSRNHQPVCDALAVQAANLVLGYLPAAFADPADTEARDQMAEASVMAGLAFAIPKTNCAHVCSYPLTARYGIPHGEACAMTIDRFIRLNGRKGSKRAVSMARSLGFDGPDALADAVHELKVATGMRLDLKEFRLGEADVASLAEACMHPNMRNNAAEVTSADLLQLFKDLV